MYVLFPSSPPSNFILTAIDLLYNVVLIRQNRSRANREVPKDVVCSSCHFCRVVLFLIFVYICIDPLSRCHDFREVRARTARHNLQSSVCIADVVVSLLSLVDHQTHH